MEKNISQKWKLNKNPQITVGKPLCNSKIYILDSYLNKVPVGVIGEIYIRGCGVGNGYLNHPELIKERFIQYSFDTINCSNGIMYRTGDIGKWTFEGEIVCYGRTDFQVKIRDERIELAEIENCIKEMKGIRNRNWKINLPYL